MKYLTVLIIMLSALSNADLPIVEHCTNGKSYKAVDHNGNVIVVSCTVVRVIGTKRANA